MPNKAIKIREATAKDCPIISHLCVLHAKFEKAAPVPSGHTGQLEKALSKARRQHTFFLIEVNKEVAGFASLIREFSTWDASYYGHLDCLFIKQQFRALGLGRKLMLHLCNFAKAEKILPPGMANPFLE